MFDPQSIRKNSSRSANAAGTGWIWLVKEEILRRCSATNPPASILHIAVDTENAEGCVYVKAQNTEEAGKVFKTLHGKSFYFYILHTEKMDIYTRIKVIQSHLPIFCYF